MVIKKIEVPLETCIRCGLVVTREFNPVHERHECPKCGKDTEPLKAMVRSDGSLMFYTEYKG